LAALAHRRVRWAVAVGVALAVVAVDVAFAIQITGVVTAALVMAALIRIFAAGWARTITCVTVITQQIAGVCGSVDAFLARRKDLAAAIVARIVKDTLVA
jgi:hypothetical protein